MNSAEIKKNYLRAPPAPPPVTGLRKLARYVLGSILSPAYWLLAHRYRTPGLQFHLRCARLGLWLLTARRAPLESGWAYQFMFLPMDSTRYFEFEVAWEWIANAPSQRYLDVSSPRLFPILLMFHRPGIMAELINPDRNDLAVTTKLVNAGGLNEQCHLSDHRIEDAPFPPESFDAITCLSVIEHIPQDTAAIQAMWTMLRPGGRLLITVPCMAQASEQYINQNEYGLLSEDEHGFVFWQRFYDPALLAGRVFSVTGLPRRQMIYGEKVTGAFQANALRKRAEFLTTYPFWREPYMMGQAYTYFQRVEDLPGEGVIALEFVKP